MWDALAKKTAAIRVLIPMLPILNFELEFTSLGEGDDLREGAFFNLDWL